MAVDLETLTRTDRGPLPWHAVQPEAVLARLDASPGGLSTGEAARRRERFGPNRIATAAGTPAWRVLVRQFANPLIYALIASAGLAFALGRTVDGLVVAAVVVLNALIGFVQEAKAGAAIEALGRLVGETAVAQRDGSPRTVPADAIVPGDLVLLGAGDKVPADLRVLAARGVRADESALTGESAPVAKGTEPVEAGVALGDRTSVLHGGTLVTAGSVTGVVTETGSRTELGRIAALVERTAVVQTPLVAALQALSRSLTAAIGAVALAIMAVGLVRGFPVADAALAAVTLAVAAIPEGLPAIVTIALAVGVRRMARRRAIVRRLPAVETLGSTTVVCTDKTGTLTRNRMEVQALWTPRGEEPHELLRAAVLCSDGALGPEGPVGDPTETAVLVAAERLGVDVEELRRRHPRRDAVPFESARRHMATLNELPEGGRIVYVKGAPEVVAELSGGAAAAAALEAAHEYARAGMRVLAVASRPAPDGLDHLQDGHLGHGFTLLGLVAMTDPPRPEAIEAVEACRRAGIEVKMITGDHVVTAEAIGRAMGFRDAAARTGAELERMAGEELDGVTAATSVFARVAPEHKLRLVDSLQRQGHVVAMTGDGVNDAPALKQADIGVAMGLGGTAVARESADVVLTDDNFASIRAAVEEGRRVYDNLVKALAFVLPTNLGEALIILVAVVAFPLEGGDPLLPVLPVQILWVNLVATVTLALPLAFEAMEPGVMDRPPRPPGTPILSRFVLGRTVLVAVLMTVAAIVTFLVAHDRALAGGAGEAVARAEAQTLAVTTIVLFQVAYLLTCRSLSRSVRSIGLMSNPAVFAGIGAILLLQLAFVELPLMQDAFHSAPLSPGAWLVAAAVGATVVPVIAMEKLRRRRRGA